MNYFLRLPCKQGEYPHRKSGLGVNSLPLFALSLLLPHSILPSPSPLGKRFRGERGRRFKSRTVSTGASSLILRSTGVEQERREGARKRERRHPASRRDILRARIPNKPTLSTESAFKRIPLDGQRPPNIVSPLIALLMHMRISR